MFAGTIDAKPRKLPQQAHLSELASACPNPTLQSPARVDPYWGGMWSWGSNASWTSRSMLARRAGQGMGRVPAAFESDPQTALVKVLEGSKRSSRLDLLAALDSWRTVTAKQAATITGRPGLVSPKISAVTSLFNAGIIDIGTSDTGLFSSSLNDSGWLYRPARTSVMQEEVIPTLTRGEILAVTGGYPWMSSSQYDRHNILSTELALRVAEYCHIGTVIGEKFSTYDLLAHSGLGLPSVQIPNRADGVVVREDGLRIAIEVTASTSPTFTVKVRRWAQLLQERPLGSAGLMVLFVIADPPENHSIAGHSQVRAEAMKAIARAVRDFPGSSADPTAAKIGVAAWRDWFPSSHTVSEGFIDLSADFFTQGLNGSWVERDILDTDNLPFEPISGFEPHSVIDNCSLLHGTPFWLRDEGAAEALADQEISQRLAGIGLPPGSRNFEGKPITPAGPDAGSAHVLEYDELQP